MKEIKTICHDISVGRDRGVRGYIDVKIYTSVFFIFFAGIFRARKFSARISGMVYTPGELRPAIIVDFDTLKNNDKAIRYVSNHQRLFAIHLLVSYPDFNDYVDGDEIEYASVIRNSGRKREMEFKMHALQVIRDLSNTVPVVAIDGDWNARRSYEGEGLVTLSYGRD
jgi:hypothetical protein